VQPRIKLAQFRCREHRGAGRPDASGMTPKTGVEMRGPGRSWKGDPLQVCSADLQT
jgi:hypothetical protein